MTNSLKGKTGDDFDKSFLTEMMAHHQQAIDMSKPAARNASHQEVKTLASNVITAQTGEISKMKMWQAEWDTHKAAVRTQCPACTCKDIQSSPR